MAGLPTLSVKLDDGTGTFPHDVTAYAHLPTGLGVSRGRGDEASGVEPSQLTLRFDNVDGRFTLGSATYGIAIDQRIRVTETVGGTTSIRFTGYVQDWPTSWPSPTGSYAVATVTAVDRMSRVARRRLRTIVENEVLIDGPSGYYTLAEAAGVVTAADTSGKSRDPLTAANSGGGNGTSPTFGQPGIPGGEGMTAIAFNGGKSLMAHAPLPQSGAVYVGGFFKSTDATGGRILGINDERTGTALWLELAGPGAVGQVLATGMTNTFTIVPVVSAGSYNDGAWHHALALFVAGSGVRLYVDGALVATSPAMFAGETIGASHFQVGALTRTLDANYGNPFTGTIGHAYYGAASIVASRISAHSSGGLTVGAGESPAARLGRFASYANIPTADQSFEAAVLASTPLQAMSGAALLDAMLDVEAAEGGTLFVNGAGTLVFQNRTHRTSKASAAATLALTSGDIDDPIVTGDKQYLENYITGTREGGATQVALNQASIDQYEQYPAEVARALYTTDDQVRDLINWRVTVYGTPAPRMSSVRLDLRTLPQATQQAALNLELGDRVTISGLPSQSPFATADLIVEGWHEEVSDQAWTLTLNTVPASVYRAWTLGDATYGVLGSTTRLHY